LLVYEELKLKQICERKVALYRDRDYFFGPIIGVGKFGCVILLEDAAVLVQSRLAYLERENEIY
jgi:hypothetical protein